MTLFGNLARWPATVLAFSLGTAAMAGSTPQPIHILCSDIALAPLCDGLRETLAETPAGHEVKVVDVAQSSGVFTLRFVTLKSSAHVLSGHLAWIRRDGETGEGPVIDLSVIDAPLNADLLRDFGRQLASISGIPL